MMILCAWTSGGPRADTLGWAAIELTILAAIGLRWPPAGGSP